MTSSIMQHVCSKNEETFVGYCHPVVDLNTAPADVLAEVSNVGPARVEALIQRRPFRSWDDVERVPGISESIVERLKSGGAALS